MKIVWDTLNGQDMDFGTDGTRITRTGLVSEIPAAAQSDPLVLLRAFEAVAQKASRSYPNVLYSYASRIILRPAAGTDQARFSITYEGPPKLPTPQTRWVIQDSAQLSGNQESVDLLFKTLQTIYQPPGFKPAVPKAGAGPGGTVQMVSGGEKFDKIADTVTLNVLRPRRTLSVHGWIIGRPSNGVLNALGSVNDQEWQGLPRGYWLCTHVSSRNENRGRTPFPTAKMLYTVEAAWQTKQIRDWSHYAVYKNFKGKVPKDLADPAEDAKRTKVLLKPYSTDQNHDANGFLKVGMYQTEDMEEVFGF